MGGYKIMIADSDDGYLAPLELRFLDELGENADIELISDSEYLGEYFSKPRQLDALIINESLYQEAFRRHDIQNIFLLSEEPVRGHTADLSQLRIYKYTSTREVFAEVAAALRKNQPMIPAVHCPLIMVYSPIGGCGKTTVALGLCATFAKNGKRVLYIDAEAVHSYAELVGAEKWLDRDFIWSLTRESEDLLAGLPAAVAQNGFDYLLPMEYAATSAGVTEENFLHLILQVKNSGLYDMVVVDTSNELSLVKSQMMGESDHVVLVGRQDEISWHKLDTFVRNIDILDKDKYCVVCTMY